MRIIVTNEGVMSNSAVNVNNNNTQISCRRCCVRNLSRIEDHKASCLYEGIYIVTR